MKLRLITSDPLYLKSQLPSLRPARYIPAVIYDELVEAGEDPNHHAPKDLGSDGVFWDWYHSATTFTFLRCSGWATRSDVEDRLRAYWGRDDL